MDCFSYYLGDFGIETGSLLIGWSSLTLTVRQGEETRGWVAACSSGSQDLKTHHYSENLQYKIHDVDFEQCKKVFTKTKGYHQ